jgi:thiamine-monophosphate kinase
MESEFIAWLRARLPEPANPLLGPGDDAALLPCGPAGSCLATVDLLTEGVDFRLAEADARRVGRKALAVNLSDIAAMAGRPTAALIALALPRNGAPQPGGQHLSALELAIELYEGLLPLAQEYDVAIAGGDTNCWDGPLAISITVWGEITPRGPLRRDGAKPGDQILVTGNLGGSILGRHFDFEPRIREALLLNQRYQLHAGLDISDGLSLDLSRLTAESACGAEIVLDRVPISPAAHQLTQSLADGVSPLDHALSDGEDFELLLAVPADEAQRILRDQPLSVPVASIGQFVPQTGLWQVDRDGRRRPLEPRGYEH